MCRKVQDSRNQCDTGSLRSDVLNIIIEFRWNNSMYAMLPDPIFPRIRVWGTRLPTEEVYNALRNDAFRVAMVASSHRPSCARSLRLPRSLSGFGRREGHRGQERILLRRSVHSLSIPAASRRSLLGTHRRYSLHPVCYGRYTKG